MSPLPDAFRAASMLRLLPPPHRLAPLARALPARWQRRLLERAMARVLAVPLSGRALESMAGRRFGIEVADLGLRWVLALRGDRLAIVDEVPEASVRGSATDLLVLASRLESADTLLHQRALSMFGDAGLGRDVRELLERLPWETLSLGLRIALNRCARLARAARDAHRNPA